MTKPPKTPPEPERPVKHPGESDAHYDKALENWLREQGEWKRK